MDRLIFRESKMMQKCHNLIGTDFPQFFSPASTLSQVFFSTGRHFIFLLLSMSISHWYLPAFPPFFFAQIRTPPAPATGSAAMASSATKDYANVRGVLLGKSDDNVAYLFCSYFEISCLPLNFYPHMWVQYPISSSHYFPHTSKTFSPDILSKRSRESWEGRVE